MAEQTTEPLVRFYKAHPDVPPIAWADRAALGTMPASAFQYCEALRVASAFGWYVFPPRSISLTFDGTQVYIYENDDWVLIKSHRFDDGFADVWNSHAPEHFQDKEPPFISTVPGAGLVQIFSGYFVETAPGWSLLIRGPANLPRRGFDCFEGIVETDEFKPSPLFINFKIAMTGSEVYIPQEWPLFQVQPIRRESYVRGGGAAEVVEGLNHPKFPFDWDGVDNTLHVLGDKNRPHQMGSYGAGRRKRAKAEQRSADTQNEK